MEKRNIIPDPFDSHLFNEIFMLYGTKVHLHLSTCYIGSHIYIASYFKYYHSKKR
jgi:hypothetical protein